MSLLLDTQIVIRLEENPNQIPAHVRQRIVSENTIHLSIASVWEIAIKLKIGELNLSKSLPDLVSNFRSGFSIGLLPISLSHVYHAQQLPFHHRDPFDRMLVAQAFVENLTVVSSDKVFDAYGVNRIWK